MVLREIKLNNFNIPIECEVENKCPYCGIYNNPDKIADLHNLNSDNPLKIFTIIFKTNCCSKYFSSFYLYNQVAPGTSRLLSTYPTIDTDYLAPEFEKISENFVKIYNQARTSSKLGNFELACIGYRTAIEFLIKDFLIKVRSYDDKEISGMKLYDVITLLEEKDKVVSADVVRMLGNDKTHYIAKYDFNINQVELYLKFLMDSILKEYFLTNPPVMRK